ncbi:MAG: cytochrome c [Gammaproteobacteria bacterium]|nr:cytochrome c [Gammaproteobacteria bacterium]
MAAYFVAASFLFTSPPVRAETSLERGAYLMNSIVACGNCHTPQTPAGPAPGMELAGTYLIEEKGVFTAFAPNITPDPETGIGGWSEMDLKKAIRDGIRPDGSVIGPPMPIGLYKGISDQDLDAIVAYVRSVPPVKNQVQRSLYQIPLPPNYGPPAANVQAPSSDDTLAYGAYLAGPLGHCIECHPPFTDGHPDYANRLGAGGVEFIGPWGKSVSANITPHADGLKAKTDDYLASVITTGKRPDGSTLKPPMGFSYYRNLRQQDLAAIIGYLRSLPPLPSLR